jgi:predicted dithiol-disulfide oxidoreductase (DUF899 family)
MTTHMTGTREEWLAARLALLDAEKALARQRQELPWVRVDKEYQFGTDEGNAFLADLFRAAPSRSRAPLPRRIPEFPSTPHAINIGFSFRS